MKSIQVSIVEDQEDIRDGMRFLINQTAEFSCLSVYQDAETAVTGLSMQQPDLVIMDINLPGMTGIECIRRLKPVFPSMQFIMFTVFEDSEQVFEALSAGASGYLLKKTPPDKIIQALKELHDGGAPMSTAIARKVISSFQHQTPVNRAPVTNAFNCRPGKMKFWNNFLKDYFIKKLLTSFLSAPVRCVSIFITFMKSYMCKIAPKH